MADYSNYTDPVVAVTRGWGNGDGGLKAPEPSAQPNRVLLAYLVSHKGLNLIDIARDTGINYDHLNACYQGDKELGLEDEARFRPLVSEIANPEAEYIRECQALGIKPERTMFHDVKAAGCDVKQFGVKL